MRASSVCACLSIPPLVCRFRGFDIHSRRHADQPSLCKPGNALTLLCLPSDTKVPVDRPPNPENCRWPRFGATAVLRCVSAGTKFFGLDYTASLPSTGPLFVVQTFSVAKEVERLRVGAQHHPDDLVSIVGLLVDRFSHSGRVLAGWCPATIKNQPSAGGTRQRTERPATARMFTSVNSDSPNFRRLEMVAPPPADTTFVFACTRIHKLITHASVGIWSFSGRTDERGVHKGVWLPAPLPVGRGQGGVRFHSSRRRPVIGAAVLPPSTATMATFCCHSLHLPTRGGQ